MVDDISNLALVKVTITGDGVALLEFNRPEKLNALSRAMTDVLLAAISMVERDTTVRVVVLTGCNGRCFSGTSPPMELMSEYEASDVKHLMFLNGFRGLLVDIQYLAGADISELINITTAEAHRVEFLKDIADAFGSMRKPIIAAVIGWALGGGIEVAMMCDIIYASKTAKFGLPELSIGCIPGAGGTQRLTKALGKSKAMEMILTCATVTGEELYERGLVAQVFEPEATLEGAMACARKIASFSGPVIKIAKQSVLNAERMDFNAGLQQERTLYYSTFSLRDKTEGMNAFLEKRAARFEHC